MADYQFIEGWTLDDLEAIPEEENDIYEYKSSKTALKPETLKKKIYKAASAFWNTGGGILIVGVDDLGQVDGGIPDRVGSQRLRDWVDQIVSEVKPTGQYTINLIDYNKESLFDDTDCVILVVGFDESHALPHMAPDNRYYIRAGAHSVPASHYIVEAMRARRGLYQPSLRGLLRNHDQKPGVIELVVLAVNDIPALNVAINFKPLPDMFQEYQDRFPLVIPIIDHRNAFKMDIATINHLEQWFGIEPVSLELSYQDVSGREFQQSQLINPNNGISRLTLSTSRTDSIEKTLRQIAKDIKRLRWIVETNYPPDETDQ